jgi:hypothetical protein
MYRIDYWSEMDGAPRLTTSPVRWPTSQPSSSPTSSPTDLAGNSYFSVSPISDAGIDVVRYGVVSDLKNGNYSLMVCPVIAGTYEVHVLLKGGGVSNQPFRLIDKWNSFKDATGDGSYLGEYVADSPLSLVVSHTVASIVTSTVTGSGLLGAVVGVPVSFMITVRDPFDNVLRTDEHKPVVTAVLDRSPDATVNVWDYRNGSFNIEYIPVLSGNNILSVYVNGHHIKYSPFTVSTLPGESSEEHSYATGSGLHSGVTGKTSYFEVFTFDLSNNRKSDFDDVFFFTVSYTGIYNYTNIYNYSGTTVPCPSPPILNHPICSGGDTLKGHYFGQFVPLGAGNILISVYLQGPDGENLELSGSPFIAVVTPSEPIAELSHISGIAILLKKHTALVVGFFG